ncbi:MAG: hypothetical protein AB8F95_16790 [Bacteroidia bacterium]
MLNLLALAIDDHYDVKRGTFTWWATMDNTTITSFPVHEPKEEVTYHAIGGDSPSIGTGWEIEYSSHASPSTLAAIIIPYLKNEGYQMEKVAQTQHYIIGQHHKSDRKTLYSGVDAKGQSLDLLIDSVAHNTTVVDCSIVY